MPLPAFVIPAASALISGIANIFSGNARAEAEAKRVEAANAILERSIIDDQELSKMLRNQSRMFNAQLQSATSTSAIRSKGIANSGVIGAAVTGQVVAAEAQTLAQTEQQVSDRNAQTRARQALISAGGDPGADPVGDFFSGAISGGIAGAQFSRTLGLIDELENDPIVPLQGQSNQPTVGIGAGANVTTGIDIFRGRPRFSDDFLKPF